MLSKDCDSSSRATDDSNVIQARNYDAPVESSCLDYSFVEAQTRVRLGMVARPAPQPKETPEELDDSWLNEER